MDYTFYLEHGLRTIDHAPTKEEMIEYYEAKRDEWKIETVYWQTCQDVLDMLARSRTLRSAAKRVSEYWHEILWHIENDATKPLQERLEAGSRVDLCLDFHKAMGDIIAMDFPRASSYTRYPQSSQRVMTTKGYGVLQCDEGQEHIRNFKRNAATRLTLPIPHKNGMGWTLITTLDQRGNYGFAIEGPGFQKVYEIDGNVNDFGASNG